MFLVVSRYNSKVVMLLFSQLTRSQRVVMILLVSSSHRSLGMSQN